MKELFEADLSQEEGYKRFLSDLSSVIQTPEGARVICEILERAGTFDQAWSADQAQMTMATVLRDFGQNLLDDVAVAGENVHNDIQRMMRVRRHLDIMLRINNNEKGE